MEGNIEETFTFYRLPKEHHKHLKSTNMLERLNQELKRRTHVIRIFPNPESCLRLIRALAVEIHEGWLETHCYLNMEPLAEQKKASCTAWNWLRHEQPTIIFKSAAKPTPIKLGALSAKPTRFGGNGKASRNAIALFSKKTKPDPTHLLRFLFAELDTRNSN